MATHDTGFIPVGVVEPHDGARAAFQQRHGVPDQRAFLSVEDFLETPRFADLVFICTPDPTHYSICRDVSAKGYDVVLEKPVATNLAECLALLQVEAASRNRIFVAHVLRYSPFFRAVKQVVDSGELGAIRHMTLSENIGHWHYAHSYVRGNWARVDRSAPLVLTKSSHDLDLLCWLVGRPPRTLASWGGLDYFTPGNAPAGAAHRCLDCHLQEECIFSASRFYLNERREWPFDVIAAPPDSLAARRAALEEGPYGRCVWQADNDVCDHQTVLLDFGEGLEAIFDLQALTAENTRTLRILFDGGELNGDVRRGELTITRFSGHTVPTEPERLPLPENGDPHGGGDLAMLQGLHEHLSEGRHGGMVTSLQQSIAGHVLAFLAEESRLADSVKLPVSETLIPAVLMGE